MESSEKAEDQLLLAGELLSTAVYERYVSGELEGAELAFLFRLISTWQSLALTILELAKGKGSGSRL